MPRVPCQALNRKRLPGLLPSKGSSWSVAPAAIAAAREIGAGNLEARVAVKSRDEIGERLHAAFGKAL